VRLRARRAPFYVKTKFQEIAEMKANNNIEQDATGRPEADERRRMTLGENVILTIKVLAGFGFLGAALWGINLFTSAR
jgi:hypothetical protein